MLMAKKKLTSAPPVIDPAQAQQQQEDAAVREGLQVPPSWSPPHDFPYQVISSVVPFSSWRAICCLRRLRYI
jgi:hypothetical protein